MKLLTSTVLLATALLVTATVNTDVLTAAGVQVNWDNPAGYRDINQGNRNRVRYEQSVFKELGKEFAKLAEQLPNDQFLMIQVSDLDLAGDVTYGQGRTIRIIKEMNTPKMTFAYQLLNKDKTVVIEGNAKLNNIHFMQNTSRINMRKKLGYEKEMIETWFDDNLSTHYR